MKYLLIDLLLFLSISVFSQSFDAGTSTYAVVVGISDYQDKDIPDLRFADRDAEAFANFLRSPAGGSLDGDHLKLLLNSEATMAQFANALDWLWEVSKEGDQAIIYFSGHGDVEKKSLTQPGFLLCWDAPAKVYMSGGAFALPMLQEVVSTLAIQNEAKVMVITDACRSGKLAGQSIGGAQATAANLAKQFANEIKILSCQPNEFSLEGEQWGGGRGVFSYHLVDGLFGLADRNSDGIVTVGEIDRYLEDHVTAEAAPQSQVPILLGNKTELLATVNPAILSELTQVKANSLPVFASTDSRGFEDEILENADSSILQLFFAFKKAVAEKRFFSPENDCAEIYYNLIVQNETLRPLHSAVKRNYAAALQDDAQNAVNDYLRSSTRELQRRWKFGQQYENYPKYLERAAELLGSAHYLYRHLKAKQHYFEGLLKRLLGERNKQMEMFHLAKALQYQTIELDSNAAYAWNELGLLERRLGNYALSIPMFERALLCSPAWALAYANLSGSYTELDQYPEASMAAQKALSIDSSFALAHYNFGCALYYLSDYTSAGYHFRKTLDLDPDYALPLFKLGMIYFYQKDYTKAEEMWIAYLQKDPTDQYVYNNLGVVVFKQGRSEEARRYFQTAVEMTADYSDPLLGLAYVSYSAHNPTKAIGYVEQAIIKGATFEQLEKDEDLAPLREQKEQWEALMKKYFSDKMYYNLACAQSLKGELDKAFESLEQSLTNGWKDYDWMQQDTDLAPLRERKERWAVLMKKYFPEKGKD